MKQIKKAFILVKAYNVALKGSYPITNSHTFRDKTLTSIHYANNKHRFLQIKPKTDNNYNTFKREKEAKIYCAYAMLVTVCELAFIQK